MRPQFHILADIVVNQELTGGMFTEIVDFENTIHRILRRDLGHYSATVHVLDRAYVDHEGKHSQLPLPKKTEESLRALAERLLLAERLDKLILAHPGLGLDDDLKEAVKVIRSIAAVRPDKDETIPAPDWERDDDDPRFQPKVVGKPLEGEHWLDAVPFYPTEPGYYPIRFKENDSVDPTRESFIVGFYDHAANLWMLAGGGSPEEWRTINGTDAVFGERIVFPNPLKEA